MMVDTPIDTPIIDAEKDTTKTQNAYTICIDIYKPTILVTGRKSKVIDELHIW
jgi:hypothetical protein